LAFKITLMKITAIVATKNEENHIGNCLQSIKEQKFPRKNIEIIVVDNHSNDDTKKIALKYTKNVFDVVIGNKTKNFRGAQVNQGLKKSTGEIIFFPDADMTFDKGLFQEISQKMNRFDALYIPETIKGNGYFGKVRNFERSFYNKTPVDAIRVVNRTLFKKIGGYDEKNIMFGADDWDLTKTIKKQTNKISITQKGIYHHEELLDLKTFLRKKKKYVKTFDSYVNKWGKDDKDVTKQLGLWYRSVVVYVENDKWKKLVAHPILAISMYSIRFITWLSYIFQNK